MSIVDIHNLSNTLQLIARGGGGGSGGGGGGGSGGGGGEGIIALVGYLPTHYAGAYLRKKLYNPIGFILMALVTIAYSGVWFFIGSLGVLIGLGALVGGPAGFFNWWSKISGRIKKKAENDIAKAAATDPAWDESKLNERVRKVFMDYQADWSNFNSEHIKTYLTPDYAYHTELMLAALKLRQRRNAVDEPTLIEYFPVEVDDLPNNATDKVTYCVHAKAADKLLETVDGQEQKLFEDDSEFYEYWHFSRSGTDWLLANISQLTEDKFMLRTNIRDFAAVNNMYYSPDWGWLLLPRRGRLFKGGKFGKSDVNNHLIGVYHNVLVELYTYLPDPKVKNTNESQYLVAQLPLPKRYDSLIVEAKSSALVNMFARIPKGYNKISMEWPDFNKHYSVYATNTEQVTAFELLHPVFMEKLFALPFKVSIEVVDNVVYLYSKDKKADYPTMYNILKDAFEEMKL